MIFISQGRISSSPLLYFIRHLEAKFSRFDTAKQKGTPKAFQNITGIELSTFAFGEVRQGA